MIERRAAAVARMHALDRLTKLHLISHQDDRLGGRSHRYQVSKGNLSRLINKQHVAAGRQFGIGECPSCAGNERCSWFHIFIARDALNKTAPGETLVSTVFLLSKQTHRFAASKQLLFDGMKDIVDGL